jgi:coproporphyrinogen III oxidase
MSAFNDGQISALHCVALIMSLTLFTGAAIRAAGAENATVSLEKHEALAERYLDFLSEIDAKYFARAQALNSETKSEIKRFSYDFADYEVKVNRGQVIEKMGRILTEGKKPVLSFQRPTVFSRHIVLDVHPKSPLVGTLHMTLLFQYEADGTSAIMSWFDVLSGANRDADLAALKVAMDEVFAEHGADAAPYRARLCGGAGMDIHRTRRKTDCAGLSFQGMPMLAATEENFELVTAAFDRFLDAYFTLIERRRDEPYSNAETAAQQTMRREYFEYNLTSDLFFSNGYPPFEVWSLVVAPPTVSF